MIIEFLKHNRDCVILAPEKFRSYFDMLRKEKSLIFSFLTLEELKNRFSNKDILHPEVGLERHSVYILSYTCGKEISEILGELHNMAVSYFPPLIAEYVENAVS